MALDDADKAAIAEMIKAAQAEQNKAFGTQIGESVKTAIAGLDVSNTLKALRDDLDAVKNKPPTKPEDGGGNNASDDVAAQIKAAVEQATAPLKQTLAQTEAARKAAEEKARGERLRTEALDALTKNGFGDNSHRALAMLRGLDLLAFDDDGNPGMKGTAEYTNAPIVVPLADGVKKWAASDDGRALLPAPGGDGSGGRSNDRQRASGAMSAADLAKALGMDATGLN